MSTAGNYFKPDPTLSPGGWPAGPINNGHFCFVYLSFHLKILAKNYKTAGFGCCFVCVFGCHLGPAQQTVEPPSPPPGREVPERKKKQLVSWPTTTQDWVGLCPSLPALPWVHSETQSQPLARCSPEPQPTTPHPPRCHCHAKVLTYTYIVLIISFLGVGRNFEVPNAKRHRGSRQAPLPRGKAGDTRGDQKQLVLPQP